MRLASLLVLLAACGTDYTDPGAPGDPAGSGSDVASAPTYWQDAEPIFHTHCATCHTAGGIGPFAIDDPDVAASNAAAIASATAARTMPPWPPGGDTPALLHVRSLTQAEIDTIAAWAAAGAPAGDPAHPGPQIDPETVDIGPTDLAFDIGTDYVPDSSLSDDYRCFVADLHLTTAHAATGFQVTPGNRAIVHHVIVGLYAGSDLAALQALDAQTPDRAGWPCTGGLVPESVGAHEVGNLGAWVPGVSAVAYPAGTGQLVPAGAVAVIQMHYNLRGGDEPDRTKVAVAFAPAATATSLVRLGGMALADHDLYIAANDPDSVHELGMTVSQWRALRGQTPFPSGYGYALGVGGHMHYIGHRITITRTNAQGTQTLLDIPAWSFHWQGQYQYATPIQIANTDTLTVRCEYDNSDSNRLALGLTPNMNVTWGEGTEDEMCIGALQMVDHLP